MLCIMSEKNCVSLPKTLATKKIDRTYLDSSNFQTELVSNPKKLKIGSNANQPKKSIKYQAPPFANLQEI